MKRGREWLEESGIGRFGKFVRSNCFIPECGGASSPISEANRSDEEEASPTPVSKTTRILRDLMAKVPTEPKQRLKTSRKLMCDLENIPPVVKLLKQKPFENCYNSESVGSNQELTKAEHKENTLAAKPMSELFKFVGASNPGSNIHKYTTGLFSMLATRDSCEKNPLAGISKPIVVKDQATMTEPKDANGLFGKKIITSSLKEPGRFERPQVLSPKPEALDAYNRQSTSLFGKKSFPASYSAVLEKGKDTIPNPLEFFKSVKFSNKTFGPNDSTLNPISMSKPVQKNYTFSLPEKRRPQATTPEPSLAADSGKQVMQKTTLKDAKQVE